MREIIYSLPEQILQAIDLVPNIYERKKKYDKILICGMGGSGISGEILKSLYPHVQIITNNDYLIPEYIGRDTLSILISYSGNTEETLRNYRLLKKRKTGIVTITSNGKLLRKSCQLRVKVPGGLPPRGAIGYLFTPLPMVVHKFHIIRKNPKKELISLAIFLQKEREEVEKKAKDLAKKMFNKLSLIYSNSRLFVPVARRWQCQLNENAKMLAHINIIPEMNHNEIVGLGRPEALNKEMVLIFLNDPHAYPRNKIRVAVIKEIVKSMFSGIIDINPAGTNNIQRLFWTIMLGDFVSYYCALRANVDPMPVTRIDYLKKRLSRS